MKFSDINFIESSFSVIPIIYHISYTESWANATATSRFKDKLLEENNRTYLIKIAPIFVAAVSEAVLLGTDDAV